MADPQTIHVVVNAGSGVDSDPECPEKIRRELSAGGWDVVVHTPQKGSDLKELTRRLVREGARVVGAAGGDGTLNAVASELAGSDAVMGVIPIGTLNHFARDLSIPLDAAEAARALCGAKIARVDVGQVNGRKFINNAILGLYPFYRSARENAEGQGSPKWLAMGRAVTRLIWTNPTLTVTVETESGVAQRETPFVMVANNEHAMEGYRLGTRATLREGQLYVYVMRRMSRLGLLWLGVKVLAGQFTKGGDFDLLSGPRVTVNCRRRKIGVSLDGEVVQMTTPLECESLPGALRVLAPGN